MTDALGNICHTCIGHAHEHFAFDPPSCGVLLIVIEAVNSRLLHNRLRPMSESSRIPPELCDQIIDHLSRDTDYRPTLISCALTCRGWLPRARYHLFRSICIDWTNCHAFTRLLESSEEVGHYVTTLEIEGVVGIFSMDRLHGIALDNWLHSIPMWLPGRLYSLKKLDLALLTIDDTLNVQFFQRLISVTHLSLWGCVLTSFDIFVDLYHSLPHLEVLTIAFAQECEDEQKVLSRPTIFPQVKVIELTSSCDDYKVLKWLVSESLHHSIERLSCTRLRWANILSLKDALQSLASSLLDLEIGFDDMPDPNDICTTSFNIAPLPMLTSLTLHIHVSRLSVMPYNFFVLSELESPLLKSVRFVVKCHSLESLCMIPLVELAFILSQPRFSNLSEVYFKFRGGSSVFGPDIAPIENRVRSAFAHSSARNLLRFAHVD